LPIFPILGHVKGALLMEQVDTRSHTASIRLGIIGAGGIARTHAGAISSSGQCRIIAAADPNESALNGFVSETGSEGFATADLLLGACASGAIELDALVVCAPPKVRRSVIEPALAAGLDVLVEKPLAADVAEAEALAALASSMPDRVTALGFCHRLTPAVLEMQRLVESGAIGRLTRFENTFAFHHPPKSEEWFSDPRQSGGGSLIDTGCHSLDIFQFLVGTPELVGATFDRAWSGRGDSSATVLVRSAAGPHAGVAGVVQAGWLEPTRFHIRLVGTDGALFYDYEAPEVLLHQRPDGTSEHHAVETHEVRFERQIEAFAKAVSERKSAAEVGLAPFSDGLAVARVIDAAHRGS
jgi:1,5-anhydro-D-fructose reductase (1,5-anhydro-D-mannitol-forming)